MSGRGFREEAIGHSLPVFAGGSATYLSQPPVPVLVPYPVMLQRAPFFKMTSVRPISPLSYIFLGNDETVLKWHLKRICSDNIASLKDMRGPLAMRRSLGDQFNKRTSAAVSFPLSVFGTKRV